MSVIRIHYLAAIVSSALVLSGCVKEKVIHEKQAPENIAESFNQTVECARASCVTIQKASLGKIFLLVASGKTGGAAPQWYDLKPLVASFEKSGGRLALLGENYNSIYEEIKAVNLIQTFEILNEDQTSITFDWGSGLKTLVLDSSYDIDGPLGGEVDFTDSSSRSVPVLDAFVRNIRFDENRIELEQIAKIKMDAVEGKSISQKEETLALNIQIQPYNLGTEFKSKEVDPTRRVGFFVTKTSKKGYSSGVSNLITKWDLAEQKGPITVRVSGAVPEEYLSAVVEGALYWNKVFGKEVIHVVTGVDPQEGPKNRSISLRWIPWLDSGAAYAMGQSDPLTGEILRAQVFMPSVFTSVGSATLVSMNNDVPVAVGAVKCDISSKILRINVMAKEASDSQRLRLAQDSVRSTVAHEMGHALGLRHNFAGSFSAKVSSQEVLDSASQYIQNPQHKGLETSTTIMDYVAGVDDVLLSARLNVASLTYDKMAMDWAYAQDDSMLDEAKSLYCTDDDIAVADSQGLLIYGCERYDAGNNPLLRNAIDAGTEVDNFIKTLTASILGRLFPGTKPGVIENIEVVVGGINQWAMLTLPMLDTLRGVVFDNPKGAKYASIDSIKSGRVMYSKMGQDPEFANYREASMLEAGGYSGLLSQVLYREDGTLKFDWLEKQVLEMLSSGYLYKGKTLSGREYELTAEQREWIMTFYEYVMKQNTNTYETLVGTLLPKVNEAIATPKGMELTTEVFLSGRLTSDDGSNLVKIWTDMSHYQKGVVKAKYGPSLKETAELPQRGLPTPVLKKWLNLLKTSNIGLDVTTTRTRTYELELRRIGQILQTVGYHSVVATEQDIVTAVTTLKGLSQLDENGVNWFLNEVSRAKMLLEI